MKKYIMLVCILTILTTFMSCGKSPKDVTKESNLENIENTDTPDEELNDRTIGESITIEGVTVTVNSVIDSQTSTGEDAYEVNITYKNNSGKSLTIHPYDWHTVLQNGSTCAYVGGSFSIDNVSKGEEWTGVITLWKHDNTEKIKFESYALNLLKDDKKSATWIITSEDEGTDTNNENNEFSENVTDTEIEETTTELETEFIVEETKIETEPPTEVIPPRDNAIGVSNKDIADITTVFHKKVPNDVTGKWKCLVLDANGSTPEYVLSAYNKYGTDASVFIMEDLTGRQCAVVTDLGDMLDVSIHEYVDKEHEDAKLMASGNLLAEYRIYKDNGDVVAVEAEPVTEPPTPAPTETPAVPPPQSPVVPTAAGPEVLRFVLNLETGCVHISAGCSAAEKILPENYAEIEIWDDELANYAGVYWACGKCSKSYSDELPKF